MKSILVYLLIGLMLWQSLLRLGIYMDFKLQQDYIARVLCVNRDKPIVACNGYCQLQTRLQSSDTEEGTDKLPIEMERYELNMLMPTLPDFQWDTPYYDLIGHSSPYRALFSELTLRPVFHPPPRQV